MSLLRVVGIKFKWLGNERDDVFIRSKLDALAEKYSLDILPADPLQTCSSMYSYSFYGLSGVRTSFWDDSQIDRVLKDLEEAGKDVLMMHTHIYSTQRFNQPQSLCYFCSWSPVSLWAEDVLRGKEVNTEVQTPTKEGGANSISDSVKSVHPSSWWEWWS